MENKTCSKPPTNNKFNIEHLRKSCKITFHDNNWRSLTSLSGWWFQPLWMIIPNIWKHNPNVPNHQQNISLTTINHYWPPLSTNQVPTLEDVFLGSRVCFNPASITHFPQFLDQQVWRFPKLGLPPNHPFYFRIFHEINQTFWGSPIYGILHNCIHLHLILIIVNQH